MGACFSRGESLKIKYIPGYEEKLYGESVEKKAKVAKFHEWGITIAGIDEFISECGGEEALNTLTTRQVCQRFLKPMMEKYAPGKGASYAHYTLKRQKQKKVSMVRDADIYVVHAWDSIFLDVVAAIRNYIAPMPTRDIITVWFDMLCMNQCKKRVYSTQWLESSFVDGINLVNKVLVVMTPWDKPLVFERTWCLWEIFTCVMKAMQNNEEPKINFGLPPSQYAKFKEHLENNSQHTIPYTYFRMVDLIELGTSLTTIKRHHKNILAVCTQYHSDSRLEFRANTLIRKCFKKWVIDEAKKTMEKSFNGSALKQADAQVTLANVYRYEGDSNKAKPLLENALEVFKNHLGPGHEKTLQAAFNLGNIYEYDRELDKALTSYTYCLETRRVSHGDAHPDMLHTVLAIGIIYNNLSLTQNELKLYETMLSAFTETCGPDHEYTMSMVTSIANFHYIHAKNDAQMLSIAEHYFRRALECCSRRLGKENSDSLFLLDRLAEVNFRLGNLKEASKLYKTHYQLLHRKFKANGDEFHPEVLESWHLMASTMCYDKKRAETAKKHLLNCLMKKKEVLGYKQPDTLKTRDALLQLWEQEREYDKIHKYLYEARFDHHNYVANTNILAGSSSRTRSLSSGSPALSFSN